MKYETCGECPFATRLKDGLHCIDGKPVEPDRRCTSWEDERDEKRNRGGADMGLQR